jgi:beta-galactosidase
MKVYRPCLLLLAISAARAEVLEVQVPPLKAPLTEGFKMGSNTNPKGEKISLNSESLLLNGKPWLPVMGEFHYSRYPQAEWREELLKMKAGGIDIVATYVFWNHHEEQEGKWNWEGDRNLHAFVKLCGEVGLKVAMRCGPWCHGEVRNGGIPDWVIEKGWKLRGNDPNYLKQASELYTQISKQLDGLLWKQGGPVISVQLENEYGGRAEHIMALKKIAMEAGLDVPLYTKTGWPAMATPMPFGEVAPLYGAYPEGFWDRALKSMPGNYWAAFRMNEVRTDAAIATEQLGERAIKDEEDASRYPYLTCELGGGMASSYHRRIKMDAENVTAVALCKIGSGGNMPGYYMYHGGINPEGKTTLMENQGTRMTNYNDMPVKGYDFQAPLGACGQVRESYHALRRLHTFIHDYGEQLAAMPATLPEKKPGGKSDLTTLRWSVRSNGEGGFLFVNNHQRGVTLEEKRDVQFSVQGTKAAIIFPEKGVTVPSDAQFFLPFELTLGDGARLHYATAQPLAILVDGARKVYFFSEIKGVPASFSVTAKGVKTQGTLNEKEGRSLITNLKGSREIALEAGNVQVVVLSEEDSLRFWKVKNAGGESAVLADGSLVVEGTSLTLVSSGEGAGKIEVFPAGKATASDDGIFSLLEAPTTKQGQMDLPMNQTRKAGPAREIKMGGMKVAAAPEDDEFKQAAEWTISLPNGADFSKTQDLLRLEYKGDVMRILVGDQLVMDDYYQGREVDLRLSRYAAQLKAGQKLRVQILPLKADAPIYLEDKEKIADAQPTLVSAQLLRSAVTKVTLAMGQ